MLGVGDIERMYRYTIKQYKFIYFYFISLDIRKNDRER